MLDQPPMFLSKSELMELTGRRRPAAIARALDAMSIRYVCAAGAGQYPKVARAHVVARLVTGALPVVPDVPQVLPDFSVFSGRRPANEAVRGRQI